MTIRTKLIWTNLNLQDIFNVILCFFKFWASSIFGEQLIGSDMKNTEQIMNFSHTTNTRHDKDDLFIYIDCRLD